MVLLQDIRRDLQINEVMYVDANMTDHIQRLKVGYAVDKSTPILSVRPVEVESGETLTAG